VTTLLAALTESVSPVISYRAIVADSLASGEPPSLPIAVRPLPIDKIAALAGVSRSTVQNALREARRVGLCRSDGARRRGAKSLTNVPGDIARASGQPTRIVSDVLTPPSFSGCERADSDL
jgi:hypothetical protein